jgi:hypothetical protein
MNRRTLTKSALFFPIGWLVGCTAAQISQAENDATAVADGIAGILPSISTITGLAGGAYDTVVKAENAIKSAASALLTATGGAAIDAANAIPTALAAIGAAIGNFKVPAWVSTVLAAAQTIVPIILQAVGAATGGLAAMAPTGMSVAQARAILKAAAAGA